MLLSYRVRADCESGSAMTSAVVGAPPVIGYVDVTSPEVRSQEAPAIDVQLRDP